MSSGFGLRSPRGNILNGAFIWRPSLHRPRSFFAKAARLRKCIIMLCRHGKKLNPSGSFCNGSGPSDCGCDFHRRRARCILYECQPQPESGIAKSPGSRPCRHSQSPQFLHRVRQRAPNRNRRLRCNRRQQPPNRLQLLRSLHLVQGVPGRTGR